MNIGYFFDLLTIVTLVTWICGLTFVGVLSPGSAGMALLLLIGLMAVGRAAGMGLVRTAFRIGLPLASVAGLIVLNGGASSATAGALVSAIGAVVLMLFVFYVMLRGVFGKRQNR
jgi:hypothetical protein